MKKELFIKNTLILSASSLIIRSAGMFFSVQAAAVMGAELLGRYRLIISVYAFFLLLGTSGISVTVTRLAGDFKAKSEPAKASFIRNRSVWFAFAVGWVLCILMLLTSQIIPKRLFGEGSAEAMSILSFSLPFAGFSAALRGYFTACRKVLRTAAEQLLEQLCEIAAFFFTIDRFCQAGLSPLFCAAIATAAAEVISFFYCLILLAIDRRRTPLPETVPATLLLAMPIAVPCTASAGLRSALSAIENSLIPTGLMLCGADRAKALSDYGIISGMALPCVLFPSVLILPFSQLIITELSGEKALGHVKSIHHISVRMLKITILYSVIMMLPFLLFSQQISSALGFAEESAFYMRVLAPLIPLSYLDSAADGMLKGLDCQKSYFEINMIESVLRVLIALTLIPLMGTAGIILIILLGELVNVTLSLWKLLDVIRL